jgi:hypothetical protein
VREGSGASSHASVVDTTAVDTSRSHLRPLLAAPAVAAGTGAVLTGALLLGRSLSWPSASSNDAWAYTAWGQALARGEQLVYNVSTTPKPLAAALAATVAPLPPSRAWGVVVVFALGVAVGGLLAAGYRYAGAVGAAVAAVAFVVAAPLDWILWLSLADAVTAALVVLGIALRGPARIAAFVLAGLLRPEAWAVCALAAYVELNGSRARRALGAVAFGALPALIWVAFDLAFAGNPLATRDFQEGIGADELGTTVSQGLVGALDRFGAMVADAGTIFYVVGFVGLLVHARRAFPDRTLSFPLAVALVWAGALLAETMYGFELQLRYLLPLTAILALGWGLLAGSFIRSAWNRRPALLWGAVAAALAATSLHVARMEFGSTARRQQSVNLAMQHSLPAVEPVLACGRLGLVGRRGIGGTISRLAAETRTPLSRFERAESNPPERYAGILAVRGNRSALLPAGWLRHQTELGPLAVNPDCPGSG